MREKAEQLDTIATDKETIDETLESLQRIGTVEGLGEMEGHVEQAEDATVEAYEGESAELDEIHEESEEFEGEVDERAEATEGDRERIAEARDRVETGDAARELAEAEAAEAQDVEILHEFLNRAQEGREESQNQKAEYDARMSGGRRG